MPRQARWKGDDLYWLLNLPLAELRTRYPQYTESTLKGKKAYWKRKIVNGETDMPPKPEKEPDQFGEILRLHNLNPELATELTEQGFHIGYIKNSEGEIEYTIPLPHARGKRNQLEDFAPATPARITPSRHRAPTREHKSLFVFSDAQIDYRRLPDGSLRPIHDERALSVARMLCKDIHPDEIINLGDTVDLSSLSRFAPDSDHFYRTMGPAFQRTHDMYAGFRADNPDAKITEVDSNHNTRLKKFVLRYAPALYGVKQAGSAENDYPVMSYPFLANLGHLGVNWVSGYGSAEYVYGEEYDTPPIIFKHGEIVVSNGSTSARESSRYPDANIVRGHSHRVETHYRTTRAGDYLASIVVGTLCKTDGNVPSYHSAVDDRNMPVKTQENWQNSALVVTDYDGKYSYDHILIHDGQAQYNGKVYRAE